MEAILTSMILNYLKTDGINEKYLSYDVTSRGPELEVITKHTNATNEFSGAVLSELIAHIPESIQNTAEITGIIDRLETLDDKTDSTFGRTYICTGYQFFMVDSAASYGTLEIQIRFIDNCYYETKNFEVKITVTIQNVIYKNYKYYYLTDSLEQWLHESESPKRKKALSALFY